MAGLVGRPRHIYDKFLFRVEFDGITYAGFQKVSEPKGQHALIEHWEGGSLISDKSPGRTTFPNITAERGTTDDLEIYDWWSSVGNAASGTRGKGLPTPQFKRTGDIIQYDRDESELQRWRFVNLFPVDYTPGDWDNTTDEKQITQVVFAYDYFFPVRRPVG